MDAITSGYAPQRRLSHPVPALLALPPVDQPRLVLRLAGLGKLLTVQRLCSAKVYEFRIRDVDTGRDSGQGREWQGGVAWRGGPAWRGGRVEQGKV